MMEKAEEFVRVRPMLDRVADWSSDLAYDQNADYERIQQHTRTGRPLGDPNFFNRLEAITGKALVPQRPGPKTGTKN